MQTNGCTPGPQMESKVLGCLWLCPVPPLARTGPRYHNVSSQRTRPLFHCQELASDTGWCWAGLVWLARLAATVPDCAQCRAKGTPSSPVSRFLTSIPPSCLTLPHLHILRLLHQLHLFPSTSLTTITFILRPTFHIPWEQQACCSFVQMSIGTGGGCTYCTGSGSYSVLVFTHHSHSRSKQFRMPMKQDNLRFLLFIFLSVLPIDDEDNRGSQQLQKERR